MQDVSRQATAARAERTARALRLSVAEGALHAVMVGVAESYLGAFAVELGHAGSRLALLATLPLFLGACAQLASPAAARWVGTRRRLVAGGAALQGLSLGGFAALAWLRWESFELLLLTKCAFWTTASIMVPSWNAWMGDLTAEDQRARYFARRSGVAHVALLGAFAVGGLVLESAGTHLLDRYALLFGTALLARLGSAALLAKQHDPAPKLSGEARGRLHFRWRQTLRTSDFRIARYAALLSLGTQISAPFFTPFMLRELSLNYGTYAALSAMSILAKAITYPWCHRLASRLGLRALLLSGGLAVALIPLVWATSTALPMLVFVHLFGGAAWASLEYSSFQLQLSSSGPDVAAEFFSISNAVAGAAAISGALAGGFLMQRGLVGYEGIFLLSAALRAVPLALLALAFRPRDFPTRLGAVYTRVLSVRPAAGATQRPILMSPASPEATSPEAAPGATASADDETRSGARSASPTEAKERTA